MCMNRPCSPSVSPARPGGCRKAVGSRAGSGARTNRGAPARLGAAAGAAGTTGRFTPHRDLIDAATPNHPVLVNRFDGSESLANSVALRFAGIDESTPVPSGGEIRRDADGRLTGIVTGSAAALVRRAM